MDNELLQAPTSSSKPRKTITVQHWVLNLVLVLVVGIVAFYAGVHYEKSHVHATVASRGASGFGNGTAGGRGFARNGTIGQVTAVSNSSITVNDQRTGSSKTYTISGSTTITDNGSTVSASDITVGETVLVTASSSSSTTATRILVNPSFGGGATPPADNSTGSD